MSKSTATSTAIAVHVKGAYRSNLEWLAAHGAALGLATGNPDYRAAIQIATHLAWRAPGASVGWHTGTNANMVANATKLGVEVGMPVQAAMALVVAALKAAATTPEQAAVADTLIALVG